MCAGRLSYLLSEFCITRIPSLLFSHVLPKVLYIRSFSILSRKNGFLHGRWKWQRIVTNYDNFMSGDGVSKWETLDYSIEIRYWCKETILHSSFTDYMQYQKAPQQLSIRFSNTNQDSIFL